jgi:hypothetical protein
MFQTVVELVATFNPFATLTAIFSRTPSMAATFDTTATQTATFDPTANLTAIFEVIKMVETSGSVITWNQGDTFRLSFAIQDGDGVAYDLSGGKAVMTYWQAGATAVDVTLTIATTNAYYDFTHAVSKLMLGSYLFELVCKNTSNQQVMTRAGQFLVKSTKNVDSVD